MKLIITIKEGHCNLELTIDLNFLSKETKLFNASQVLQQSKKHYPLYFSPYRRSQQWEAGDRNGQAQVRSQ